jgi:hypothetical protein
MEMIRRKKTTRKPTRTRRELFDAGILITIALPL